MDRWVVCVHTSCSPWSLSLHLSSGRDCLVHSTVMSVEREGEWVRLRGAARTLWGRLTLSSGVGTPHPVCGFLRPPLPRRPQPPGESRVRPGPHTSCRGQRGGGGESQPRT